MNLSAIKKYCKIKSDIGHKIAVIWYSLLSSNIYDLPIMDLTTILIISCSAIAIYIAFLVLGFSLKGKNTKAQNLENKN